MVISYAYLCIGPDKSLFGNTNTQKTVAKEKSLHTEEKLSFVYFCIGVSGQRNHSLRKTLGQRNTDLLGYDIVPYALHHLPALICGFSGGEKKHQVLFSDKTSHA